MWEHVKDHIALTPKGYVIFDDTVLDKRHARKNRVSASSIERQRPRRHQWHWGVVTCVYVHPQQDRFWLIDYRIYDPQGDGKTKLDHLKDMLSGLVLSEGTFLLPGVLMDSWYATKTVMRHIEQMQKNLLLSPQDKPGAWTIRQAQSPTSA